MLRLRCPECKRYWYSEPGHMDKTKWFLCNSAECWSQDKYRQKARELGQNLKACLEPKGKNLE